MFVVDLGLRWCCSGSILVVFCFLFFAAESGWVVVVVVVGRYILPIYIGVGRE